MTEPKVGIWWAQGKTIAAMAHSATDNTTQIAGRIDSNLSHADEWPLVAATFGCSPQDEYYNVPRGRVLWDTRQQCGIIIHGPATNRQCLQMIAARFQLGKMWKAERDLHYSTGADADRLFDDEE